MNVHDDNGSQLKQVTNFKYLGSTIEETGGCELEVKERVRAAWNKWREVKGVVCDKRMPRRVKVKVYQTMIRPVMMYGAETWALRRKEEQLLMRTEMRMLRWILGVSLWERCTNEEIRKSAGVTCISEKLRDARLRWFGHVWRREDQSPIQRARKVPVRGRRSVGRQRLRWRDIVRKDMERRGVQEHDAGERSRWRRMTRAADP